MLNIGHLTSPKFKVVPIVLRNRHLYLDKRNNFFSQSLTSPERYVEERVVTAESRALKVKTRHDEVDRLVKYCLKCSPDLVINQQEDIIRIFKLIGMPSEVVFSIVIKSDFSVEAYRRRNIICVRSITKGSHNQVFTNRCPN